ncbi:TnsA endonuclease N-terminal domain-containing protein [Paenibacillus sp. WC2504]|uniref:TnsA endonuclease N-terminal domain-containing protein n=1 Tax=Paenibacillus sp. WC2504 TaxID=3461403 RepID=UPI0040464D57
MYTQPVIKKRRNGRYGNNNWIKYSSKIQRDVFLYSDLEYDHWILIEFDKNVKYFCEQPLHVKEFVNGEWVDTIFDMWIMTVDNKYKFVEIKYAADLNPNHQDFSKRSSEQVEKQRKWCSSFGHPYEVHSEDFIYQNKLLLNNYKIMLPYIDNRKIKNDIERKSIINILKLNEKSTIRNIEVQLPHLSKQSVRDTLYNLIYEGVLNANLGSTAVGINTEVWLVE